MKLEKFNYSDGKRSRWFLYGVICTVLLMVLMNLFLSQAKYLNTESVKIAEGTISYKPYDFKIMAMYQENENSEYEEIETMPTSGYAINEAKSYCTIDNVNKDSNAILKTIDGNHTFSNLSKNDKCYLYFDKLPTNAQELIAFHNIATRTDFSTTITANTTGIMYSAEDDYGTSYYFAGNPTDNWIKFAGFYWRIIRINGDGTIRMIYQGTAANTTGTGTEATTSAFNTNMNNNMYVGYMYTNGQVHGTGTTSTIKGVLDSWYNSNLSGYASYIATGGGATFCNDRQPSTSTSSINGSGGTGTTTTYYAAYIRLVTNKNPSFKCVVNNDRFSTSIGLITADEVSYAGGVYETANQSYYLYTGYIYWTMSPYNAANARVFRVNPYGILDYNNVDGNGNGFAVRPVINLKSDTQFSSGDGTSTNPYTVK